MSPVHIRAVRGATTVDQDTAESIRTRMQELFEALLSQNGVKDEAIIMVLYSMTHDIQAEAPAKVIREQPRWQHVPMLCLQEAEVANMPKRCIRILVQIETERTHAEIRHLYLHGAQVLRPDLS